MAIHPPIHLAPYFSVLGVAVSFCVYLAPVPTFYRIYKKKSTEGFQCIPYAVALFSAMLLFYYGFLKTDRKIITINIIGCAIEGIYIILFMIYATREAKVYTTKLLLLFNIGAYGLIIFCTAKFTHGHLQVTVVGWICAVFSVCVFAAPLSSIRLVIRTKSVEYMTFALSFFLTLCAVIWFFYGFLRNDWFIAAPNILGFLFGIAQMILYMVYKDSNKQVSPEVTLQNLTTVIDVSKIEMEMEMEEKIETNPNKMQEDESKSNEKCKFGKCVAPRNEDQV